MSVVGYPICSVPNLLTCRLPSSLFKFSSFFVDILSVGDTAIALRRSSQCYGFGESWWDMEKTYLILSTNVLFIVLTHGHWWTG